MWGPGVVVRIELMNAAGVVLLTTTASGDGDGSASLSFPPIHSGTYYAKVGTSGGEAGPYSFSITVGEDSYETDDALTSAKDIPVNGVGQLRTLHSKEGTAEGDRDIARFRALAGFAYDIRLQYPRVLDGGGFELFCLNGEGETLASVWQDGGAINDSTIAFSWTAPADGYYYVLARAPGVIGTYRLVLTVGTDPFEPADNSLAGAPMIGVGGSGQRHSLTEGDVDYVRFEAVSGVPYAIRTDSLSDGVDTAIEVTSKAGIALASEGTEDPTPESRLVWVSTVSDTVFVRVMSRYTGLPGTYTIRLEPPESAGRPATVANGAGRDVSAGF